jgi:hypothetical protein
MDQLKLIEGLSEELQGLGYREQTKLDAIVRRAEMIIRNVFGSDSRYIEDLQSIQFYPMFAPSTEKYKRECWRSGTEEMQNLFNTMKEEILLFGTSIETEWENEASTPTLDECFVDLSRMDELRGVTSSSFDLAKLIKLCEELNICYANECFLAVTMLTRTILDHVPPILGVSTFKEVANNYGGKSFKNSMQHLQNSSRNIADSHLHLPIRKKESLPTRVQVNFRNDLDVLLAEIVRVLK